MLNIIASLATLVLTELLLVIAWLKAYENPRLYYLGIALLILAWSNPWSNRDRYRTYNQRVRMIFYLLLVIATVASWFFFGTWQPLLITAEVLILALIEALGWSAMKRA